MNIQELFSQREQALAKREAAYATMNSSVSDQAAFDAAQREYNLASAKVNDLNEQIQFAREQKPQVVNKNVALREALIEARSSKQAMDIQLREGDPVEVILGDASHTANAVYNSGAINLSIKDLIDTQEEGLTLPAGISQATGVTGNELIPYSINDVEVEEVGETTALTDQAIDFDNITVTPHRCGLTVTVSNTAIDNAAFDLLGLVRKKFTRAISRYKAMKFYSQAAFTGNAGPFSGLASSGTITLATDDVELKILEAVAKFVDAGFSSDSICFAMSANTEAKLKATLRKSGIAGRIIENGKLLGYNYTVSHWVNTKLGTGDDANKIVNTSDKSLYIMIPTWEAIQQHGDVRMTVDATSKAVAVKNVTAITLNTSYSFTDMSKKINGKKVSGSYVTQAFARYVIA